MVYDFQKIFVRHIRVTCIYYIIMKIIYIQDCAFTFHSVYDLYAASEDGRIVHIIKQIPHLGDKDKTGLIYC